MSDIGTSRTPFEIVLSFDSDVRRYLIDDLRAASSALASNLGPHSTRRAFVDEIADQVEDQLLREDRLLSINDVSARTTVPVPTLRLWRHKRLGPKGFKLGGRLVYKESDVEAWVEEQYATGLQAIADRTDG